MINMEFDTECTPAMPAGHNYITPGKKAELKEGPLAEEGILAAYRQNPARLVGLCYTPYRIEKFEGLGEKVDNVHIVVVNDFNQANRLFQSRKYDFIILAGKKREKERLLGSLCTEAAKFSQNLSPYHPVSMVDVENETNLTLGLIQRMAEAHDLRLVFGSKKDGVIDAGLSKCLDERRESKNL